LDFPIKFIILIFLKAERGFVSNKEVYPLFKIKSNYVYLEWPALSEIYVEEPYFLTLDDQGQLRIHNVKARDEKIVTEGELYHSAAFSMDGRDIYAMNEKQEFCVISVQDLDTIVSKRKIPGLDDPEMVTSKQILQISPFIMAVGSLRKTTEESTQRMKPYLHVVCGDLFDVNSELRIREFPVLKLESFSLEKRIAFRFLFIKERFYMIKERMNNSLIDKFCYLDIMRQTELRLFISALMEVSVRLRE